MADTLDILGQAWIYENSKWNDETKKFEPGNLNLIQEKITMKAGKDCGTTTVTLIDNIWDNVFLGGTLPVKTNGKGYFYWEYKMTDTASDSNDLITIKYECPKPTYEIARLYVGKPTKSGADIKNPATPFTWDITKAKTEYAKYWTNKFIEAENNYNYHAAIQKKEITFAGSICIDKNGNINKVESKTLVNNDLGDITNLLSMF